MEELFFFYKRARKPTAFRRWVFLLLNEVLGGDPVPPRHAVLAAFHRLCRLRNKRLGGGLLLKDMISFHQWMYI